MVAQKEQHAEPESDRMLDLKDVADRLKVSKKTVTRWEDTMPAFPKRIRLGRVSRWRESDVNRFIRDCGK